jgi:hypothetical protein
VRHSSVVQSSLPRSRHQVLSTRAHAHAQVAPVLLARRRPLLNEPGVGFSSPMRHRPFFGDGSQIPRWGLFTCDSGASAPGTSLQRPETGRQNRRYGDLGLGQRRHAPHLNPQKCPQTPHYSSETGKHRFSSDCVVVDAAPIEPVSSLHFGQMQGDFRKMQGGPRRNLAKSHQISIAWNGVSLLKRAGKSRENHLCPAGWRSRLRPDTGDCPLEPVLASNLQHLHFSECQLEPWETRMGLRTGYANAAAKLLGLNRCRQSRCGNRSEAKRRALALADTRSRKMPAGTASCLPSSCPTSPSLLVLEGLDIAITGTEKLSVCDAGNVGS